MTIRQDFLIVVFTLVFFAFSGWLIDVSFQSQQQTSKASSSDTASAVEVIVAAVRAPAIKELEVPELPELPDLLPDFSSQPIPVRKNKFVAYMVPFVKEENQKVYSIRQKLQPMQLSEMRTDEEIDWLKKIGRKYRVATDEINQALVSQLMLRIDGLPPSLVLAQAAVESAWGTSRFAQKANNIFGHWCMTPGCGIVPKGRPETASYEVHKFESVQQAVHRYFMNLNTNRAYAELRDIRACHRLEGESLSGPVMAGGLVAYSGGGMDYIELLRDMIRVNKWAAMDGDSNALQTSGCYAQTDQIASSESSGELRVASRE
jgi:Bax protein